MKKYLYENPRGFANEFSVFSVDPELISEAEKIIESYNSDPNGRAYWIKRKEAEKLVATERKTAREQDKAGLNLSNNPVGATEIVPLGEWLKVKREYEL